MSTGFGAAVRPKAASRNSVGVQPQRRRKNRLKWQMLRKPEAAPVFTEVTASELQGSGGKIIARIHFGTIEAEIYAGADRMTVEAMCRGLRYAE